VQLAQIAALTGSTQEAEDRARVAEEGRLRLLDQLNELRSSSESTIFDLQNKIDETNGTLTAITFQLEQARQDIPRLEAQNYKLNAQVMAMTQSQHELESSLKREALMLRQQLNQSRADEEKVQNSLYDLQTKLKAAEQKLAIRAQADRYSSDVGTVQLSSAPAGPSSPSKAAGAGPERADRRHSQSIPGLGTLGTMKRLRHLRSCLQHLHIEFRERMKGLQGQHRVLEESFADLLSERRRATQEAQRMQRRFSDLELEQAEALTGMQKAHLTLQRIHMQMSRCRASLKANSEAAGQLQANVDKTMNGSLTGESIVQDARSLEQEVALLFAENETLFKLFANTLSHQVATTRAQCEQAAGGAGREPGR
jgi:chromosome segregation ATPase